MPKVMLSNNVLNYEVGFLQVIRRPQKLQIWFQMGVVRHAQSNSKQRVSYISKLRYEVFFLYVVRYT